MAENPIIVITGATSGIGQLASLDMAKRGARLVLTARSKARAEAALARIRAEAPSAEVDVFYGDLSLLKDAKRLGQEIAGVYPRIDVLVNNAGLHAFEQRVTAEGFPEMIAVNYLAPWVLSQALLNPLRKAGPARIVNVASEASRRHGVLRLPEDLTDTAPFTPRGSSAIYGKTKLLNIMFTGELSRRLAGTGIGVNALNPGFNVTGLGRELRFASVLERILKGLHIGDPRRGAGIITRLAMDREYEGVTGGYFNVGTGASIAPVQPGGDKDMQAALWKATETVLEQRGLL